MVAYTSAPLELDLVVFSGLALAEGLEGTKGHESTMSTNTSLSRGLGALQDLGHGLCESHVGCT